MQGHAAMVRMNNQTRSDHRLCRALAGVAFCLAVFVASPGQADSLAQMLYDVYDNNPELRAEEAGHEAQKANSKKARAALMPQVSAHTSYSYTKERLTGGSKSRMRTSQYGIKASQRLFNGFRNRNNLIKAKYEERSSAYRVRNKERQLLLDAVKAYMDVYAARKMIALRRQHVTNMQKQRRATRARIRAGELTRTDLSKTDALLARARAALEGAQADLAGAVGRYETLAGYTPGKLVFPQQPVRYLPKSAEEAETKAITMHPDLRSARATKRARDYAVKAAQGAYLPTLDLSGEYNRNFSKSVAEDTDSDRSVSLRLSLPLFDGGSRAADVQRAKAERKEAVYRNNALRARIKADAREAYMRHKAARATTRQAKSEVKAASDLLRGIRIEEKAGQRSYLDILDAEIALLDAREIEMKSTLNPMLSSRFTAFLLPPAS